MYYRRVPNLIFMEMFRSGKLKTNSLKRLVLAFSLSFSFDLFQELVTKLPGCSIAINAVHYFLAQKLENFNATKTGYWWRQLGHLDISSNDHTIHGFPEPNLIKSLRIYSADQDFFDNWLPRMTLLESLFIELLENVNVERKITLKNLDIRYMDDDCDCSQIFDFLKLKSLQLWSFPLSWQEASQRLLLVMSLRIVETIRYLPDYSLQELHYRFDIPEGDFKYILRHPITYLSFDPRVPKKYEWWHVKRIEYCTMKKLKGMSSLTTLRIRRTKYRVVQCRNGNKYTRISNCLKDV